MLKLRYCLLFVLIALIAALGFTGCGGDDDDDDDDNNDTGDDDDDSGDDDSGDDDDTGDDDDDDTGDDDDDTFDPAALVGLTYNLNIPLDAWTEPSGVGDVIGYYVPAMIFNVQSTSADSIDFLASVGVEDPDLVQDDCVVTTSFPGGTLDELGAFEVGPEHYDVRIQGSDVTLQETTLSGTFTWDGSLILDGEFAGFLDAREMEEFFANDADMICLLAASFGAPCVACPSDEETYCVQIKAEGFTPVAVEDLDLVELGEDDISPDCYEDK